MIERPSNRLTPCTATGPSPYQGLVSVTEDSTFNRVGRTVGAIRHRIVDVRFAT